MLARAAIRDVGRVLGLGYGEVDRIAKAVPNQLGIKLEEALEIAPPLREMYETDPQIAQAHRARAAAGGRGAQRVHPRGGRGHQPRAAHGADAAPEGDQLGRAHDPVRDARRRGAGPAQVRLPGPLEPDHPAPGGRPHRGAPGHRAHRPRPHPARRREDLRAAQLGRDDRRVPARVRGHAPLHQGAAAHLGLRPRGHGGALPPRPDGQHPGLHPAQARPGAGDLPPPAAQALPGEDVRRLRLPGGHHGRGHRAGRLHGSRGGHPGLRDPQEEVRRPALDEGQVRHPGGGAGRRAAGTSTRCSRRSSRSSATASTRPTPRATASSRTRPRTSRRTTRSSTWPAC